MTREPKLLVIVVVLAVVHVAALFAGFVAPYSYREQNRDAARAEPTEIRFVGLRPHVQSARGGEPSALVPLRFFVRGSPYELLGVFPWDVHLFGVDEPHRIFVLGTDALGRDYFSRLVYGGQLSLFAGVLGASLALACALVLGAMAGYGGRVADDGITWLGDVFLSLPWLYMLLAARAFLPLDMDPGDAFLAIVVLLGVLGWAAPMRIVRGVVLSAKERAFVDAARSAGAGHAHILTRHILPQTYSVLATQAALLIPGYMLAEVTLSFVGLGVGEPRPSWGNMLAELPRASIIGAAPGTFAPAVLIVVVTWLYHSVLSSLHQRDPGAADSGSAG